MRRCLLLLLLALSWPRLVRADEYGAAAVVRRARILAVHDEDATASGTVLSLLQRVTMPRSLGDVVREAPGARVQNTGALGSFATVSLRGADPNETLVMLDEIPLVTPDGGAFDLGLFPAELFQTVEVFRSGSPVWLGSGAIGGVLRLVPWRSNGTRGRATLSAGSFGQWQLQLSAGAGDERMNVTSQVVARGARNDYPYDDDKGTRFDPSDDEELRRKNAQLSDGSGYTDFTLQLGKGKLHLIALGHGRTGGYPGPGSQPTPNIHRQSARALLAASYEQKGGGGRRPRHRFQLVGSGVYSLDRYTDLLGELGTSKQTDTDDKAYRAFLRAAATLRFMRWLEATWVSSYALDGYHGHNRFAFPKPAPSTRHTVASALELAASGALGPVKLELRPSARVEWSQTALHANNRSTTGTFDDTQSLVIPTFRVGAAVQPHHIIALSASIATGARLPTMFELFGDRGQVLASPTLQPVRSTTFDGGVTLRGERKSIAGSLELHAFQQQRRHAISMFRTAQWQVGHENLGPVKLWGIELGASGCWLEHFSLQGSLTYLNTEHTIDLNRAGTTNGERPGQVTKQLPFRPPWVAFVRPELTQRFSSRVLSSLSAATEFYYRSYAYVDRANLAYVQKCMTIGAGASVGLFSNLIKLSARIDDAADARCSDLVGFPLPGRSLFFSLSIQETSDDHA